MTEPSLDLQKAIRSRLIAASAVTSLVPANAIVDRSGRPEAFPCVLIGEAQTVMGDGLSRNRSQVFADLHVWQKEAGLAAGKTIVGAIKAALADGIWTLDRHHVADLHITSSRFLRDPSGLHSHSILSVQAMLVEF